MKVFTCPKCGNKMIDAAPNFCPNCGCKSMEFVVTDVVESATLPSTPHKERPKETRKHGFSFLGCVGVFVLLLVVGFIILIAVGNGGGGKTENYNDNSQIHQILAKNWFVDKCVKPNMHDANSYEEVNYDVSYNYAEKVYIVTVSFRGKNAFGAKVLSTTTGSVKFTDDDRVQCRILTE